MTPACGAGPGGYVLSTEQITRDTPAEHVLARDDFASRCNKPGRNAAAREV